MRKKTFLVPILIFIQCILFTITAYSQDTEPIRLPFVLTDGGHTMIKANINGVEGNFIFDTGAGMNMLTKNFADSVSDLEKTDGFHTGHRATGEEIQTDIWKADHFAIDQYKLKDELFSVYDIDFPFDGLISLTVFKDVPVTIDYKNEELVVESEASMEKKIKQAETILPIQISVDQEKTVGISTYIHLDNKLKLQVKLDSGAGFDVYRFNARYMEPLGIDSSQVEHEFQTSIFKPEEGNDYYYAKIPMMSTSNGKIDVQDFKATFIDDLIYEGIMGINWLGDKITIDVPNKRLIIN